MTDGLNRVVVITGAASGIGAALARTLAGSGTALMLHTRKNETGLGSVADDAMAKGSEVDTFLGDLGSAEVPEALIAAAQDALWTGRPDRQQCRPGGAVELRRADAR